MFGELAAFGAEYAFTRGGHFDIGGGYMFTPMLGIGLNVSGDVSEGPPTVDASVPHPLFFNAYASDSAIGTTMMRRTEAAYNIQFVVNAFPRARDFSVRLFAGPSYFRVTQDTVSNVIFNQVYGLVLPTNAIDITNYEILEVEGFGWGFHGGVDMAGYFNRVVGIGGGFKMAAADVPVEDVLGEYDSSAGGPTFYGGLRLRF